MRTFNHTLNFFTQIVEELAKESQFKKRQSKLTPTVFIRALLKSCFSQQFGLEIFRCALKQQKVLISKQALFERFNERTATFLKSLASAGLKHFKTERLPQLSFDENAFFVSRLLTGTALLTLDGNAFDLVAILSNSPSVCSQQLLVGAKAKIPIRLVVRQLPAAIAEQRRRKLKAGYRRRGITPSKELLYLQAWSIYITNTSETQISNEEIHSVYACRWQIELVFKLGKSLMQLDSIKTTKSYRVIIEMYGKFIGMMLLFLLCAPVRYQKDKELSFYKACKLLIDKASDFIRASHSIYRLKQFLINFWEELSLFAIKDIKKKPPLLSEASNENDF